MSTLVVLAAGLGSRFGGPKQLEPLGPGGETLLELTLHDAWCAGFRRAVLVTRAELLGRLRERLDDRVGSALTLEYALQDEGPGTSGSERRKPWGTAHAVLAARALLDAPFGVANADDLYGASALVELARGLERLGVAERRPAGVLIAYRLDRTLSPNGGVSRGICALDPGQGLMGIEEVLDIGRGDAGQIQGRALDGSARRFSGVEPASLNLWGFDEDVLTLLDDSFARFRAEAGASDEYQLPTAVGEALARGTLRVQVQTTDAEWLGVTHPEDALPVRARLRAWFAEGRYPTRLFT
ncbi:MAG: NTP transferase domain-containing protein [Gemmatimonadota bacterium]